MEETNCKDWAIDELNEIKEICSDLKYGCNKQLKLLGLERIDYLANKTLEHLEYLELKEVKDEQSR